MGSKTRLSSYCTKRANNGVNLVMSRKINTRLARQSRTTLQNKVRLKVLPEQLNLFVNTFVAFKNASFNNFLLYHPDYC